MDSTYFNLPKKLMHIYVGRGGGASKAATKFNFEFDLLSGEYLNIDFTSRTKSDPDFMWDTLCIIEEKDLCIRDLGYYSTLAFNKIADKKAYFISKVKSNTNLYSKNIDHEKYKQDVDTNKKSEIFLLDVTKITEHLKEGETIELEDIYIGKSHNTKAG